VLPLISPYSACNASIAALCKNGDKRLLTSTSHRKKIWWKPHKRTVPLSVARAGTPSDTMSPQPRAEANLRTNWYPDPSSHLAIIYIGRKVGVVCAPCHRGGAGSPSNTCGLWAQSYLHTK